VIGTIKITNQIGAPDSPGKIGGNLLSLLQQFKALPQGTRIVNVEIASPGGFVEEGDEMYNYLESEKANYVVNTVQIGDIASIATKLFLVGDSRKADRKFKFMIHNPWTDPGAGDSKWQAEVLESLLQSESALRKFYSKKLNITEEGLAPLMDRETFLSADQLLTLGFATQLKQENVMALKKEGVTETPLKDMISALYKKVTGKEKAEGVKALDLQLADGSGVLSVDAPDAETLVGATATLDGNPAPDGDYTCAPDAEGMSDVVSVKGGVVTAVTEAAQAATLPQAKEIADLKANIASLTEAVSALVEKSKAEATSAVDAKAKEINESFEARIVALKSEIGTVHNPKRAATVYAQTVDTNANGHKTISQQLAEKADKRRKQLNGI